MGIKTPGWLLCESHSRASGMDNFLSHRAFSLLKDSWQPSHPSSDFHFRPLLYSHLRIPSCSWCSFSHPSFHPITFGWAPLYRKLIIEDSIMENSVYLLLNHSGIGKTSGKKQIDLLTNFQSLGLVIIHSCWLPLWIPHSVRHWQGIKIIANGDQSIGMRMGDVEMEREARKKLWDWKFPSSFHLPNFC